MDDWEKVISFGALYEGLEKARRNVMWKDSVSGYSLDGLENSCGCSRSYGMVPTGSVSISGS